MKPVAISQNALPATALAWPSRSLTFPPDQYLYDIDDWRISLNEGWRCLWRPDAKEPRDLAGFQKPGFNDSQWDAIDLPATWEMKGYGTPLYVNYGWPFRPDPPQIPVDGEPGRTTNEEPNPTMRLRQLFTIPEDWKGRLIRLYVGAAQAKLSVWVNGIFIGSTQDAAAAFSFDLSHACKEGANTLAFQVWKYAEGSYLEDQDAWRFSGIYRDVFLYSVDPAHIEDAYFESIYEERAILVHATIANPPAGGTLEWTLGNKTATIRLDDAPLSETAFSLRLSSGSFPSWHPEKPGLISSRLVLRDADGVIRDIRHARTALRSSLVRDGVYLLNGTPFRFQGVNRHEIDSADGRVMTRARMEQDARLIKDACFNAVRTAHGTHHPLWYEICDRIGLAVLAEANVESHGLSYLSCVLPGDRPEWRPAVLERIERMVRTLRNHPSVVLWSLGNEAGYGDAFSAAAKLVRELDSRPIQYADMNAVADFDSQTYPTVAWLREWLAGRAERKGEHGEATTLRQHGAQPSGKPFLANEYAHAMGNSTGNFAEIWQTFESSPRFAGGFVWEWCEHALFRPSGAASVSPEKRTSPECYGGDFHDSPNSGNFCCDGLVRGDRVPNPGLLEVRSVQMPLAISWDESTGELLCRNRYDATSLQPQIHSIGLRLLRGGWVVSGRVLSLERVIPARGTWMIPRAVMADLCSKFPAAAFAEEERILRVGLLDGKRVLAECEYPLDSFVPSKALSNGMAGNPSNGFWPFEPVFDRVPTDNDRGCFFTEPGKASGAIVWRDWTPLERGISARRDSVAKAGCAKLLAFDWRLHSECGRIGIRATLPASAVVAVEWYGRGPGENYPDRHSGAFLGWHQCTRPLDLCTLYTRPQENGERCDCRILRLYDGNGTRTEICADAPFGFCLRPYRSSELAAATHASELLPVNGAEPEIWELTLDAAMRGVGGDNSWGLPPMPAYRLLPESPTFGSGTIRYLFRQAASKASQKRTQRAFGRVV